MRQSYWATQSAVTDPGPAGKAIDELPADLAALRQASSQLVFHYRAGGGFAENGVPAERVSEIDTRYADAMFGHVLERGEPTLARDRRPADRLVGCCRDATVFFLALARHKGIPARARVGFSTYFDPGWLIDHVVAEVWDEREGRWRLVDPEMNAAWTPEVNGRRVDWLDLTPDQFVTGPRAWRAARAGTSDPERHVVHPDLGDSMTRGWPYIAHNAIHDLAALNKTEMLLWDAWGMQFSAVRDPVPAADAATLDEICAATADPDCEPGVLAGLGSRDGLRIPPVVTSFDVNGGPPRQVDVSRALGRLSSPARMGRAGRRPRTFGIRDFEFWSPAGGVQRARPCGSHSSAVPRHTSVKQIRIQRRRARGERSWLDVLPANPRDPDVVRAKALARARDQLARHRP